MKLKELPNQSGSQSEVRYITITVISNITLEPYFQFLINKVFAFSHISVKVKLVDYWEFISNKISDEIEETDIVAIIPNFEGFYQEIYNKNWNLEKTQDLLNTEISNMKYINSMFRSKLNSLIIWFGYEDYYLNDYNVLGNIPIYNGIVDEINIQFVSSIENDIVFVDLKRLIAQVGIAKAYDNRNKYRWSSPYSKDMVEQICNEIYKQYLIYNGKTKKCIVLDCDNVLWSGILSEDGIEGIHLGSSGLGREYQDFQRFLLNLHYHGVILTVCSKNDKSDVLCVFREHSGMILKEEHIACFQVDWNDKPTNIKKIADELNIGIDSMVFVDDSIFEIEAVKAVLSDVATIQYDRELMYNKFSCFNLKNKVNPLEIEQRNETYRTNRSRRELKAQCDSYDEYIDFLNTKINIYKITPMEYSRVAELTQRTNKCTNGKRYTVSEIKKRITIPNAHFYSVSVSDRFSDLGIVGAFEIEDETVTLFSLSCRALGRNIENEMINYLLEEYSPINIEFKLTEKNQSLLELLQKSFPNVCIINL